ncbi:MAG TPA: hypothetical protein VL633_12700 [Bacteroidota bacterium]|jgi:hypothetical protein|nr:hypothetical protein [Bacteroidota bacterium]
MIKIVITLCLFVAVHTTNSQQHTLRYGASEREVTGFSEKAWASPDSPFGCGTGSPDAGDGVSEDDGLYGGHYCNPVHPKYPGHPRTTSILTVEPAIVINRKLTAPIFDIIGMNVQQKSNGYLFRIHSTKQLPDFESWLKPIGEDTWLYITLADAQADVAVLEEFKLTAFVKKILIFQSPNSVQLTLMLKGHVSSVSIIPVQDSRDIYVIVCTPMDEPLANSKDR